MKFKNTYLILPYVIDILSKLFLEIIYKREQDSYSCIKFRRNRYIYIIHKFLCSKTHSLGILNRTISPFKYLRMNKYARLIYKLENTFPVARLPHNITKKVFYYDNYDTKYHLLPWGKKVFIDYGIPQEKPEVPWMLMPYSMHPVTYKYCDEMNLTHYRGKKRVGKLFFIGNFSSEYNTFGASPHIQKEFSMLSRMDILNIIYNKQGEFGEAIQIFNLCEDFNSLLYHNYRQILYVNKFVLPGSPDVRISQKKWLPVLSMFDFFLAPPGVQMPLCHNIIEAIAEGTIPFTNYYNWFEVPLEDGKNCIAFNDEKELLQGIHRILNMSKDQIKEMRENVILYYKNYLNPEAFVNRIYDSSSDNIHVSVILEDSDLIKSINKKSFLFVKK